MCCDVMCIENISYFAEEKCMYNYVYMYNNNNKRFIIYTYVCMYICTHIYVSTCLHTWIQVPKCTFMYVVLCIYVCTSKCLCISAHLENLL